MVRAGRRPILALWPGGRSDRIYGAPDFVVEVLSPNPRIGRLDERIGWFVRSGVRECWLVNTVDKSITVLSLSKAGVTHRTLHAGAEPIRSAVLPGLRLNPLQVLGW